jgi:ATP phosphoribosyltransferase
VIRLALPAGDHRPAVAELLGSAGLTVEGYGEGSRSYRLAVTAREDIKTRVFRERDIPIQVALGNYDVGICNVAWVKEMSVRFPEQPVVAMCDLGIGEGGLFGAVAQVRNAELSGLSALATVSIASEYPNLAEALAIAARLPAYRVQAVWGSAEGYPPEDADLVVVNSSGEEDLLSKDLQPVHRLLDTSLWLIANKDSVRRSELGSVVAPMMSVGKGSSSNGLRLPSPIIEGHRGPSESQSRASLRLAVPDGHQQRHVVEAITDAGLALRGYDAGRCERRPQTDIDALEVKVVRPHDMPQLVALGQFDLAITGRDCLMEHLYRFPSSPVQELVDLRRGQYNLSAVVSQDLPAETIDQALEIWRRDGRSFVRVASEFMGTADHYARSRHMWRYRVIPIAGASEGFVPEDAELLIEGTETGKTLKENRLKPIDLLYRSTTCVIGQKSPELTGRRERLHAELVRAFENSARAA